MKVQVEGMEKVLKKLSNLERGVKDLSPAFDDVSVVLIQEFKANFNAQGRVLEAPWEPRIKSYPWPILQKTGKMKGSWKSKSTKKDLEISNTAKYAQYHHFGSTRLPVRKLVNKTNKIMKMALDRIENYLRKLIS
jgi:phage gpG-like protein